MRDRVAGNLGGPGEVLTRAHSLAHNPTPHNEPFFSDLVGAGFYYGSYSIGMDVKKDGTIFEVLPRTPAYDAGLGPQMTARAIDGHPYSTDALNESIAHPRNGKI